MSGLSGSCCRASGTRGGSRSSGGGLFPRSALILRRLLPETRLTVIDVSRESLDQAIAAFCRKASKS
jgi:hypothetical protein